MAKVKFETKLGFGKYARLTIDEVWDRDPKYLLWCAVNFEDDHHALDMVTDYVLEHEPRMTETLLRAERLRAKRKREYGQKRNKEKLDAAARSFREFKNEPEPSVAKAKVRDLTTKWYRQVAHKWHPDKHGGNNEGMKAINDAYSILKNLVDSL